MSAVAAADHELAARPVEVYALHCGAGAQVRDAARISHLNLSGLAGGTCGVVAVSFVSAQVVRPVAVVGVKQVDVFVVVTGQEFWADGTGSERLQNPHFYHRS